MRNDQLTDELAERLYDSQHENCDDECVGGGRLWYDRVAARLTSPVGPLFEIANEREMQDDKWGDEQNHPDGTSDKNVDYARHVREVCQTAADEGRVTWAHVLTEEVGEAFAETDPEKLRAELIQVAAVACAWVEAIDRRTSVTRPEQAGGA